MKIYTTTIVIRSNFNMSKLSLGYIAMNVADKHAYEIGRTNDVYDNREEPRWVNGHSVNCYFCGWLFDERDGENADKYNNNDGGSICPFCLTFKEGGNPND